MRDTKMIADGEETAVSYDFSVSFDREEDGRWIASVSELPGVSVYGATREEALLSVQVLALRVIADRLEHGHGLSSCGGT